MRKSSTTKMPGKRELTDFAPAVYLEFMRQNMLLFRRDILSELIVIEAEIEHEEIRKKIDEIIDRKSEPIPKNATPEEILRRIKKTMEESAKLDRLWARQEELQNIMFPDTTPEAIDARREAR